MAAFRKIGNKWRAEICVNMVRKSKTFPTKRQADEWALYMEAKIKDETEPTYQEKYNLHVRRLLEGPKEKMLLPAFEDLGVPEDHGLPSKAEILEGAEKYKPVCGIYFLIMGGQILYVGQSLDIHSRLSAHLISGKEFTHHAIIECDPAELSMLESKYIALLRPPLNHNENGNLVLSVEKSKVVAALSGE